MPNITAVEPTERYNLRLSYETGEVKIFDVSAGIGLENWPKAIILRRFAFAPAAAGLNGQDIAPHELYERSVTI